MKLSMDWVSGLVAAALRAYSTFGSYGTTRLAVSENPSPTLSFTQCTKSSVGEEPSSIAVGDFNGDGQLDLVTANQGGTSGMVSVLLGDGSGGFGPPVEYGSGGLVPIFVIVGAPTGGNLAVANQGNATVKGNLSILLNDGSGPFCMIKQTLMTNYMPHSIAKGHFGSDTRTDLALANIGRPMMSIAGNVETFLGNSDGTFQAAVDHDAGDQPHAVAIADFTNDGVSDILVANGGGDSTSTADHQLTLLVADSMATGGFDGPNCPTQCVQTGAKPVNLAVTAFNNGHQDFASANLLSANGSVTVGLDNGTGTF